MRPETSAIAITCEDGSLVIMHFVTHDPSAGWTREATDEAINREIARTSGVKSVRWRRIAVSELPSERTYRNAWVDNGTTITVDPVKRASIDTEKVMQRTTR